MWVLRSPLKNWRIYMTPTSITLTDTDENMWETHIHHQIAFREILMHGFTEPAWAWFELTEHKHNTWIIGLERPTRCLIEGVPLHYYYYLFIFFCILELYRNTVECWWRCTIWMEHVVQFGDLRHFYHFILQCCNYYKSYLSKCIALSTRHNVRG